MESIPEEFNQIILIKINKFENKLSNCDFFDFLEAFKLYYRMMYINFNYNITLGYGQKLLECEIQCHNEEEKLKVEELKSFIKTTINDLEIKIEKDKRRILN